MSLNYSSIVHLMMKNYIHWTTFIEEVEFFNCWWKTISSCRSIGQKILSSRYSTYFIWGWWRLKVNYIFWDRLWSLQLILLKGLFQQSSHLSLGKVFNYTELPLLTHAHTLDQVGSQFMHMKRSIWFTSVVIMVMSLLCPYCCCCDVDFSDSGN